MLEILTKSIIVAIASFIFLPTGQPFGQDIQQREQYVYVLQVAPRFKLETSWTDIENAIVARHFERLAQAARVGQVILAGRTNESLDRTFQSGLMTATLHPYAVALQRQ